MGRYKITARVGVAYSLPHHISSLRYIPMVKVSVWFPSLPPGMRPYLIWWKSRLGETMRRSLMLHGAAGRILGIYALKTPGAGRHFRHDLGGLAAWFGGMPSYYHAISISFGVNDIAV